MKSFKLFLEDLNNVSDVERTHIKHYVNDSSVINNHNYKKHTNDYYKNSVKKHPSEYDYIDAQTKPLDSAIGKSHLEKPTTLYSGVKFHPDKEASKHPDRLIHLPAFTSTSKDRHVASSFSDSFPDPERKGHSERHVLEIRAHPHHKALDLSNHEPDEGGNKSEEEVILPRHTTLKIAHKPETHVGMSLGKTIKIHHWKAEIVHQGEPQGDYE